MVPIDAMKYFSASVNACFLSLKTNGEPLSTDCAFFDNLDAAAPSAIVGFYDGMMLAQVDSFYEYKKFLGQDSHYTWRSGVKHDSSKIMEFRKLDGRLHNGYGELVDIEDLCVFPLLKSSDLGNRHVTETRLKVLITQRNIGASTGYIRHQAPLTWQYLERQAAALDGRKSAIYRNQPRFAVFGVGDYTFTDWKVAISGFYKRLEFQVIGPIDGKPVIFDDTIYFLSVNTQTEAAFLADLLNSEPCQKFLESMVFWSDKRPITIDLLKRLDLEKLASSLDRGEEYSHLARQSTKLVGDQYLTES